MSTSAITAAPTPAARGLISQPSEFHRPGASGDAVADAKELRTAFTNFVGNTVFSQMLSSMRSTVKEPAYFHGGRAEEMFQSQLDQTLADEMTAGGGSPFARAMFEQQFPEAAQTLREAEANAQPAAQPSAYDHLAALPRR